MTTGHTLKWQSPASSGGRNYQPEEVLATVSCSNRQHWRPRYLFRFIQIFRYLAEYLSCSLHYNKKWMGTRHCRAPKREKKKSNPYESMHSSKIIWKFYKEKTKYWVIIQYITLKSCLVSLYRQKWLGHVFHEKKCMQVLKYMRVNKSLFFLLLLLN